jgi:hypothetical protein
MGPLFFPGVFSGLEWQNIFPLKKHFEKNGPIGKPK